MQRRTSRVAALALCGLAHLLVSLPLRGSDVPDTLYDEGQSSEFPTWVSLKAIRDTPTVFSPTVRQTVEAYETAFAQKKYTGQGLHGCPPFPVEEEYLSPADLGDSLPESLEKNGWIGVVRITGAKVGVLSGTYPGTMLAIETEEELKGTSAVSQRYLFFPGADSPTLCVDGAFALAVPRVGDRLLLMLPSDKVDSEWLLWWTQHVSLVLRGSKVFLPKWQRPAGSSVSELAPLAFIDWVRSRVRDLEGQ